MGTSVGALLAQLLDLYFVGDERTSPWLDSEAGVADLKSCFAEQIKGDLSTDSPPACKDPLQYSAAPASDFPGMGLIDKLDEKRTGRRLPQLCALKVMFKQFVYNTEAKLMCVEKAPLSALIADDKRNGILGQARPNLIRFDPMASGIIDPMLSKHAVAMSENNMLRTLVAVQTTQNQTLGLDERACIGRPSRPATNGAAVEHGEGDGSLEYCLSSSAMASLVLPFFARPVRHTYSGLRSSGECGAWLDGGLRSSFPAYRALRLSRPNPQPTGKGELPPLRVLALETGRLQGLPSAKPLDVKDVALNGIAQMSGQNAIDEIVGAQRFAAVRQKEIAQLLPTPPPPPPPPAACFACWKGCCALAPKERTAVAGSVEVDVSLVRPIFVPDDAPPALIAEAGYSFDGYVMRGLFAWGQRVAIKEITLTKSPTDVPLADALGWPAALAQGVVEAAREDASTLAPWFEAYKKEECPAFHTLRFEDGRKRILNDVKDCGVLSSSVERAPETPDFFSCPAGVPQ